MLKRFLRRSHFRRQLTVLVGVTVVALALFSALLNSWEASQRMRDYLIEQGLQVTESLARQSTLALLYSSAENARNEVAATLAFPDVLLVEITDTDNRVLLQEGKADAARLPALPAAAPAAANGHARLTRETDQAWRFTAPVYAGREEASPFELHERQPQLLGHVHVVVSKDSLHHLVTSLLLVNLLLSLSFAAILLGFLHLLVERLIQPLNSLSDLMRRAERGESGLRARASGPRDITDMAAAFNKMMAVLEEREAELQRSRDRALQTAQMKTQFAATVSHEVRTPLNGVVGMLDLLREMRLSAPQRECVDVAWNSAQALMELINGILDFSKLEAGKLELEEIEFDLRELAESAQELLAKQAQQKGLELGYLLEAGVPARIRGDSLRLRQVLVNLMSNAVKFTEQGEVAVRIGGSGSAEDFRLRFEVSDTGIGMDENTVQHVFESFAQADPSTTRKYGGTGLGLTISKHLVDLMGGEMGVSSRQGEGTTFWFSLPCLPTEAATAPEPPASPQRFLLLENSRIGRAFLQQSLQAAGLAGEPVESVAELQARLEQAGDCVLVVVAASAVATPGDAARLRAAAGTLPLLLLGSGGAAASLMPTLKPDACLGKPLRYAPLLAAVRQLLSGDAALTAEAPLPPEAAGATPRQHRVLVVEDNPTNQMVASAMLARQDCLCEVAGNGHEAVEAVRRAHFDIIFMDCNMPEMDGYEATACIRVIEQSLERYTPIIAMTANAQSGDEERCLLAGMDDYLAKPITLAKLRQKLDTWLVGATPPGA